MRQLLILSGKGGTGKTTIASAFIKLSEAKTFADCDVDAPNLHLSFAKEIAPKKADYMGMEKAVINPEKCISCGLCMESCRFHAIEIDGNFSVNRHLCEGCGMCTHVCPVGAIEMKHFKDGEIKLYKDKYVFSTAQLEMGSGTSGKLVTEVKNLMKKEAGLSPLAIVDGSPGIGCTVIAQMSGVDLAVIVAEPSVSGISDMCRVMATAEKSRVSVAVCVNKYNLNSEKTEKIKDICKKKEIPFLGTVPFEKDILRSVNEGGTILDTDSKARDSVIEVYERAMEVLDNIKYKGIEIRKG